MTPDNPTTPSAPGSDAQDFRDGIIAVAQAVPGLIYSLRVGPDGSMSMPFASQGTCDIFGVPPDQFVADFAAPSQLLHPDDVERTLASIHESARTMMPWRQEFRIRHPNKGERWIEGNSTPIRETDGSILWRGYMQDVTDRKATEEVLHYKNEVLLAQQEASIDGILVVNADFSINSMNSRFAEMWELPPDVIDRKDHAEILKLSTPKFASPEAFTQGVQHLYASPVATTHEELPLKDGRIIERHSAPLKGPDGQSCGRLWTFRDITRARKAEQALRESEELFSTVFRVIPIGINIFRLSDGRSISANDGFAALIGFSLDEIIGHTSAELDLFPDPEVRSRLVAELRQIGRGSILDAKIQTKSGEIKNVLVSVNAVTLQGEKAGIVVATDISDRKRAEGEMKILQEKLVHAQKMEAIGRLAGGVAHDFNNLLQVINSYSKRIADDYAHDPDLLRYGKSIHQAGEIAANLTRELLAFSRKIPVQPRKVELDSVLGGMEDMIRGLIGEGVTLQLSLKSPGRYIMVDPNQIEQILMNLVVNARDAMPSGGLLTLSTSCERPGHTDTLDAPADLGLIDLTVADSGHGMDSETRKRIFEPFFTTKPLGRGTGLGLSTVYGIVQQCGAEIAIESQIGAGTEFRISFPLVEVSDLQVSPFEKEKAERGSECILVVEDDSDLRDLYQDFLTEFGYSVLTAEDGRKALDLIETTTETIDLIISDTMMPVMDGIELFETLQRTRPDLKLLLMSGNVGDRLSESKTIRDVTLLAKPFSMEALSIKVRQLIGGAHAQP